MHTNGRIKSFPAVHCTDRRAPSWMRAGWLLGAPQRLLETLRVWHDRAVERRELLELDERILRDCGLDRAEVQRIARKPFWRA